MPKFYSPQKFSEDIIKYMNQILQNKISIMFQPIKEKYLHPSTIPMKKFD
jgi:hypothetical protein